MLKFEVHMEGMNDVLRTIAESATKAEHIVAQQVAKDTLPFVPASGNAAGLETRTRVDGSLVIYPGPYARFLYYGKVMVDPNTGSTYAPKGGLKVATDRDLVFNQTVHPQAQDHWFEASKAQNLDKWERVAEKAVKNGLDE